MRSVSGSNTRFSSIAASLLALGVAATACSSASANPQLAADGQPLAADGAPEGEGAPRGPLAHLDRALAAAKLDDATRAKVDALRAELAADVAPAHAAARELSEVVAKGVEAGALDPAAVDAGTDKLAKAIEAVTPAAQATLVKIHAALSAEQRSALVEAMRPPRRWFGGERGEPGEHARGPHGGPREHLARLTRELDLRADQVEKLRAEGEAAMRAHRASGEDPRARFEAHHAHMKAVVDAFVSERFDPAALGVGKEAPEMARRFATHAKELAGKALPVLDATQRQRLAAIIRERAARLE